MPAHLLTTGKVARLCSVKPDTVLKWIKKGRLPASRTAGGHYRVDERDLARLAGSNGTNASPQIERPALCFRPMRCWEYMTNGCMEECRECDVYKQRTGWCFRTASRGGANLGRFCRTTCQDCPYYRRVHGLPTNVLVVTNDDHLVQTLARCSGDVVAFRFAHRGYDASAVVSVFRPACVVFDQAILEELGAPLLEALASDPRVVGAKILVAIRKGSMGLRVESSVVFATLEAPFNADDLVALLNRTQVETIPEGEAEDR